jgi:protein gp37
MADETLIAWTHRTHNEWHGCTKYSKGCDKCYAMVLSNRYGRDIWGPDKPRMILSATNGRKPYKWNQEAKEACRTAFGIAVLHGKTSAEARAAADKCRLRVFCGSMMDWAEDHPTADALRPGLWTKIRETPYLDWQLLTKRSARVRSLLPAFWDEIKHHVWIGVSIESPAYAHRADDIRDIDSVVRFISYEPALASIAGKVDLTNISWLIMGGESGPGYRPMDHQWARDIRAKCRESGTAFFFKQSAAIRTEMGIELDGEIVREYPA